MATSTSIKDFRCVKNSRFIRQNTAILLVYLHILMSKSHLLGH